MNAQILQKLNDEEKAVVSDVSKKYTLFLTAPLALGCVFGIRHLIRIGYMSPKYKLIKYGVGGILSLNIGTFLTEREIDRRLMEEVPNGTYSTLKKEVRSLSDQEKTQYFTVMRQKGFVFPHQIFPEKFVDLEHVVPQTTTANLGPEFKLPSSAGELSSSAYSVLPGLDSPADADTETKETKKPAFSYRAARQKWQPAEGDDSSRNTSSSTDSEFSNDDTKSLPSQPPSKLRLRENKYGDEME